MLDEILNEIFLEASKGEVIFESVLSNWVYHTRFLINKTSEDDISININDMHLFKTCIKNYLDIAYDFYVEDKDYFELNDKSYVKKLVYDLLVNGDYYDYQNIYNYIDNKTEILKDNVINVGSTYIGKYLGYDTNVTIKKNHSSLEAPYQFVVTFNDNMGNTFELPQITFAVANNKAYLMCVQNKSKEDNVVVKKLDRYFRKLNKDIDVEDDIYKISPRALASFTIFNSYLKSMNIEKLEVKSYLPLRYESKVLKNKKSIINNDLELIDRDQYNMTNRLMYLVKRYAYHFDESKYYFDDITQRMHLKIVDKKAFSNNIIFEIDNILKSRNR